MFLKHTVDVCVCVCVCSVSILAVCIVQTAIDVLKAQTGRVCVVTASILAFG